MTAPDRIWAWYDCDEDGWDNAYATTIDNIPHSSEYVRSDIHAALQAENERLREALRLAADEIDQYIWQEYPLDHPVHERYRQRDLEANPARAALK